MPMFFFDLVMELPEHTGMNKYAIMLMNNKQFFYLLIYIICPVELEILKIYIKTYLKTRFIQFYKSLTGTSI